MLSKLLCTTEKHLQISPENLPPDKQHREGRRSGQQREKKLCKFQWKLDRRKLGDIYFVNVVCRAESCDATAAYRPPVKHFACTWAKLCQETSDDCCFHWLCFHKDTSSTMTSLCIHCEKLHPVFLYRFPVTKWRSHKCVDCCAQSSCTTPASTRHTLEAISPMQFPTRLNFRLNVEEKHLFST